ncbi:MAG: FAD-binding protein [Myxococcota bacterium]
MTARVDVAVIGSGLAGFAAALAARQAGANVVVLHRAAGGTALASGAWDVAPPLHPEELLRPRHSLVECIEAVAHQRPAHPYAVLADPVAAVREAHARVLPALGGYRPLDLDGPGVLAATDLGLLRRSGTVQREVLALEPEGPNSVGVVDLGGAPTWDADFLAASFAERVAGLPGPSFAPLRAPLLDPALDTVRHPHELAAETDVEAGCARLVAALREASEGPGANALLLPPVLGLATDTVAETVERAVGRPLGEALAALAGPQGLRLDRRLRAALAMAGAECLHAPVAGVTATDRDVRIDLLDGRSITSGAAVLATGKHVAGGLLVNEGRVREPVAGLPVRTGGELAPLPSSVDGPDPVEQFGTDWWDGGPGFSQGVGYDADLRALGAADEPATGTLFVAGALLDGFDPARDGTGLGCCATTGFLAGRNAAAQAGR